MQSKIPSSWILPKSHQEESSESSGDERSAERSLRNLRWTRVLTLESMLADNAPVFNIDLDVQSDSNIELVKKQLGSESSQLLFDPDEYRGNGEELTVLRQTLSEEELLRYAQMASRLRRQFVDKAEEVCRHTTTSADGRDSVDQDAPMKLRRRYEDRPDKCEEPFEDSRFHNTEAFNKIRLKKLTEINLEEQEQIALDIRAGKLSRAEIASKYKAKIGVIYRMAVDIKRGSARFKKRESKHDAKLEERSIANEAIARTLEEKKYIYTIAQIQERIKEHIQTVVRRKTISESLS